MALRCAHVDRTLCGAHTSPFRVALDEGESVSTARIAAAYPTQDRRRQVAVHDEKSSRKCASGHQPVLYCGGLPNGTWHAVSLTTMRWIKQRSEVTLCHSGEQRRA